MLGKDYMLAIILVNCDDNLWSDQNLEAELDLPSGWRKIHDSSGTYYWHVPTGTTQWQHPSCTSGPDDGGEAAFPEMELQAATVRCVPTERIIPSPVTSFSRKTSLAWHQEDLHQGNPEPGSKVHLVRGKQAFTLAGFVTDGVNSILSFFTSIPVDCPFFEHASSLEA